VQVFRDHVAEDLIGVAEHVDVKDRSQRCRQFVWLPCVVALSRRGFQEVQTLPVNERDGRSSRRGSHGETWRARPSALVAGEHRATLPPVSDADGDWLAVRLSLATAVRAGLKRGKFAFLLVLVGWLAPAGVQAAELRARGPAPCPDTDDLRFRVEEALGMPLERAAPLHFDVLFERSARSFSAKLRITANAPSRAPKQRLLEADDCSELADAVSIAIALALGAHEPASDPAAHPDPPAAPAVTSAPAAPALGVPVTAPAAQDAPTGTADRKRWGWWPELSVAVVFDSRSLPAPSWGLGLGAELRAERFAVRALGTLLFDQHADLATSPTSAGADLGLALGSLSACTSPLGSLRDRLAVALCGGWELGRLSGLGTDIANPHRRGELWSAPRVDAELSWAAPGTLLRFGAQLTLAAPLNRDDFVLGDLGTIYRPPGAVGRIAGEIELGFE
jgi:hypothetical protein